MSETPMHLEVNCATGEQILRPLTAQEIAQRDADAAAAAEAKAIADAEAEAKADAKLSAQAKLQALGLTGDEIVAMLG